MKAEWLLTKDERDDCVNFEDVAKAQAEKIAKWLNTQCDNPKHRNYKYGKLDCHECIDDLIASLSGEGE